MNRVNHCIRRWPCGGGMETIARIHFPEGRSSDDGSAERRIELLPETAGLWTSVRALCRKIQPPERDGSNTIHLHYNGYGVDWNCHHQGGNKWIYLHSDFPELKNWLGRVIPYAQGILCVSDTLGEKVKSTLPGLPRNRVWTLPLPVVSPSGRARTSGPRAGKLVIGYAGRIQIPQKRLDRVAEFIRLLDGADLDYKMEFLGTGAAEETLRKAYKSNRRIEFHGHKTGEAYREIIGSWRYMVFFSDYEGLPLALLDGLSAGVVPVYPDHYNKRGRLAEYFPESLYSPGDIAGAVTLIKTMESSRSEQDRELFCRRTDAFLKEHTLEAYLGEYCKWRDFAESLPPLAIKSGFPGLLPVWMYHRYHRLLKTGSLFFPSQ